jgi:hydrogenase maturation protease
VDSVAEPDTVVLGLGNLLRRDEGLGVWALQRLAERYVLPESVRLVDGGTLGLELISEVEDCERLLVLDATLTGADPGTFIRLAGGEVPAYIGLHTSSHEIGLADMLAVLKLRGREPSEVVLLGLQPAETELGWGLSRTLEDALEGFVDAAAVEVAACTR